MDGNIKDTPPIVVPPPKTERANGNRWSRNWPKSKQQADARRKSARPEFDGWLAKAIPGKVAPLDAARRATFHALLGEGAAIG